ncbi:U4/U6 small nuclear ribonucleoprotein PRP4-like protein [Cucumis melo var. makuwa]|uniref:U4/U6 small nuclear ribonucleoprotein PRP4-like protein n=1 Tax=Cucumis melo var. makuwa TaxID=1194695 RepID=A0A5A7SYS7_CUCMM|nr:U4/U6 small nuclear ribonucleoprotein PRP4-like protein [Cucumis melo var. makuwa]TYK00042.1 U4/U6 small nuclear ribonucleoprotein PRP4-like protein [Cucumis melo var. makuwa]
MARLDAEGQLEKLMKFHEEEEAAATGGTEEEIGDDRPLSGCSFSSDGKFLATSSLSGVAKLWSMPQIRKVSNFKGHTERVTDVMFSPVNECLATASADRTARITSSRSSRSVYGIAFHHDGSLVSSCVLDALACVWDLRTGRSVLALEGHVKPVLGVSFSPNGYHLATGGEDNTCRIWDLRKKKFLCIIPAHSNLVSQVKYEPQEGYFLVTASFDMIAKIWSARDVKPVKSLSGHEAKVTSLDIISEPSSSVPHENGLPLPWKWKTKPGPKISENLSGVYRLGWSGSFRVFFLDHLDQSYSF